MKKKRYVIPEKIQFFATLFFVSLVLTIIGIVMLTSGGSPSKIETPITTTSKTTTLETTEGTTSNVTSSATTSSSSTTIKPEPEVFDTKLGKIRGEFSNAMKGQKFLSFKGVPYAAPPLGNSRFKVRFQRYYDHRLIFILLVCKSNHFMAFSKGSF